LRLKAIWRCKAGGRRGDERAATATDRPPLLAISGGPAVNVVVAKNRRGSS